MSAISVYQGNTKTVPLFFTGDNGAPLNVSGLVIHYVAKRLYADPIEAAIVNQSITGDNGAASTGLVYMSLTTGETSYCVGNYIGGSTIESGASYTTYDNDGFTILPSPMGVT